MYTILHRSGWASDNAWKLGKTFTSREDADNAATAMRSANPRDGNYIVKIVSHRSPVKATGPDSYKVGSYTAYD